MLRDRPPWRILCSSTKFSKCIRSVYSQHSLPSVRQVMLLLSRTCSEALCMLLHLSGHLCILAFSDPMDSRLRQSLYPRNHPVR
ncbi:hypothetical protein BDW66DRAFT_41150 [Aspergillus desertorum]